MRELEVARQAAQAGGDILAGYFRQGIEMRNKQDCDFVSDADVESERAIIDVRISVDGKPVAQLEHESIVSLVER